MKWLSGKSVRLRAVEPEDIEILLDWENNPSHWEVSGTLTPFSRDLMKKYIENAHLSIYQTGQFRFIIETIDQGLAVGTADIFDFEPTHKRAGVGILIGDNENRNMGYATEAIDLLIAYSFNHLELHQLYCNILIENNSSIRIFEKMGFKITGTKKSWVRSGDIYKDEYFMQLIK